MSGASERVGDVVLAVDGDVVTATIDRPDKRNAINYAVIEGLHAAVARTADASAKVLVLRGAGGTFCAGADLNLIRSMISDPDGLETYVTRLSEVCDALSSGPFVSLAVVTGHAVAGGCELLLACDLALASDDARIGDRHLQNALLPGAGGSVRLFRALTPARARRLFYTAEMIIGKQAEEWGLVCGSAPVDRLDELVDELVGRIADKSLEGLQAFKRMTQAAELGTFAEGIAAERQIFVEYAGGSDAVRNALTSFLEKADRRSS